MSKGRILIADNNPEHIAPIRDTLELEGYDVLEAHGPLEAKRVLGSTWIHLAVIDVRLINDDDEADISGLTVVKETDPVIPKIVLTMFPDWKIERTAYDTIVKDIHPVVTFVDKAEGLDALVAAVDQAFTSSVRVNRDLEIEFGGTSFVCLVSLLEDSVPNDSVGLVSWAEEFADLFRKLFFTSTKISIFPVPYQGRGGAIIVQVRTTNKTGETKSVIVKCGSRGPVARENINYETYVGEGVADWSTRKVNFAETLHFAGIVYSTIQGDVEETERFSDFYRSRDTSEVRKIVDVLGHLFTRTSKIWYGGRRQLSDVSLDALYLEQLGLKEDEENARGWISTICREAASLQGLRRIKAEKGDYSFHFSDKEFLPACPDPLAYAYASRISFPACVSCCVTHGDLNGNNILVDEACRTWLIDFERTGFGHALRDFGELEGVIRWELVTTRNLSELYEFEQALLNPTSFDEDICFQGKAPDLTKAAQVIDALRKLTGSVAGGDIQEYYMGLLFYTVRMIVSGGITSPGQGRPSLVRRAHAFLSAAMICKKLRKWDSWRGWEDDSPLPPIG